MKAEFKAALLDRIRWFSFSYSLLIETHLSSCLQKKRKSLLENLGSAIKHLKCCTRRVWASLTLIRRCFNTMLWSVAHSGSPVSAQRWIQTSGRKHTNTLFILIPVTKPEHPSDPDDRLDDEERHLWGHYLIFDFAFYSVTVKDDLYVILFASLRLCCSTRLPVCLCVWERWSESLYRRPELSRRCQASLTTHLIPLNPHFTGWLEGNLVSQQVKHLVMIIFLISCKTAANWTHSGKTGV